jgi:hypothetical protein
MADLGQDVNRSLFVDFETGLRNGKSAWESFRDAGVNALGKIADKLASMAVDNLWKAAFGGSGGGFGLGSLFGPGGGGASAGAITLGGPSGPVPLYADGTDSAPGGLAIVGERGPELVNLPRGSQVIPNDKIGGGAIHIDASDNRTISVGSGASPESVKQLQSLFEQGRRDRANQIVQVVRKAKQTRQL